MLNNYLAAALRNLARNKLYAAINVAGLGIGFAAAILIALFIRDELSYDRFLPEHEHIYRVYSMFAIAQSSVNENDGLLAQLADSIKLKSPEIEAVARISYPEEHSIRYRGREFIEEINWADPNLFEIFRLPTVAGDLRSALAQPDNVVISREIARKYFGDDDPIGKTLELDRKHSLRIAAVLGDLPSNTSFGARIIASGLSSFSQIAFFEELTGGGRVNTTTWIPTYIKAKSNTSLQKLRNSLANVVSAHPEMITVGNTKMRLALDLLPISAVHRHRTATNGAFDSAPDLAGLYALGAIALLIVLAAAINFVNLMTACAEQRAIEVGIRKVSGARRHDLVVQYIGESLIYAICGLVAALAIVEVVLPSYNAFLQRNIAFDYAQSPGLLIFFCASTLMVGVLAGTYPAFVLADSRPVSALGGKVPTTAASSRVRRLLVVLQFSVLIGLLLVTMIIYRQTWFATNEALRLNKDEVVVVETRCSSEFRDAVSAVTGVRRVACSGTVPLKLESRTGGMRSGAALVFFQVATVDAEFFEVYGLKPLAGRTFDAKYAVDIVRSDTPESPSNVLINESLRRSLGFDSAASAVGQTITWARPRPLGKDIALITGEIVGVVPDFVVGSVSQPISPTIFYTDPSRFSLLSVKLDGRTLPHTLDEISRVWKRFGEPRPVKMSFFDQRSQQQYKDTIQMNALLTAFSGIAALLACLGLFGLSVFIARKRTKEIGIRKAMGAGRADVMRLLIWQFTKPVLWANLIAWPVAGFVMNRWLHGFAYRIDLEPWLFVASGVAALLIALLTVSAHCYLVARAKPVAALRYE